MTEEREAMATEAGGTPRWVGLAVVVLAVVSLAALGIGWSASTRAKSTEQSLATEAKTLKENHEVLSRRLQQAEEVNAQLQGELNVVTDRLKLTQAELGRARKQAKQIREDYSKKLTDIETSVKSELATKASAEEVKSLTGDVTGVRSDLEATKQNLQMARGEFGTLVARNHDEIEQLRRLGERDYFEFTLARKGSRQKLGDVEVELRGANPKKHQFTIALYVDDLRLEKKNRAINEPIYFYTRGARAPLELVVNQVTKNKVVGYLSVPKVKAAAAASSSN